MDIEKILKRLREEVAAINATIRDLERFAATGKVRGRPATWMAAARAEDAMRRRDRASASGRKPAIGKRA